MNFSANKTLIISIIFMGLGVIFIIAENMFYQYVDDKGFLHESMFMPLGAICILLGIIFLLFVMVNKLRITLKK
ncbi:MAG: hypothetical protein ACI9JR_002640 [Gammaproteobacteria bacterium]|jgi:hypothetical protein